MIWLVLIPSLFAWIPANVLMLGEPHLVSGSRVCFEIPDDR